MQRAIVHWKCEGLSDEDAHRSVLPASPRMTMAGIVSHLRWAENTWFEVVLLGRSADGPQFKDSPQDADMRVDGVPLDRLLDEYERQCAVSDAIVAERSLDHEGRRPDLGVPVTTLRWILFHMIEETARHAGHMDAVRELLDGRKGYF